MFRKVIQKVAGEVKPVYRFNEGFQKLGFQVRPKDTRTMEEIKATIDTFLKDNKNLEGFKKEINSMQPEHLGLVADVLELSKHHEMLPTAINMNKVNQQTGKSLTQALLEVLPKASKENPGALEFAQEVINHTDTTTSKYFLADLIGVIKNPELSEKFKAAKPMVKDVAEKTLSGSYTMDYTPQQTFMSYIKTLVNENSKTDKLKILPDFCKAVEELPTERVQNVFLDTFVNSSAPVGCVKDNISVLKDAVKLYENQGKSLDLSEFVTRNVNLK